MNLEAFWTTASIILGIFSPLIALGLFAILVVIFVSVPKLIQQALIDKSKKPPFDDVEVNLNPATKVLTARFIKHGVTVWQGDASRLDQMNANADSGIDLRAE